MDDDGYCFCLPAAAAVAAEEDQPPSHTVNHQSISQPFHLQTLNIEEQQTRNSRPWFVIVLLTWSST